MADLEESILKQNVPGRYSKWDQYEQDDDIRKSYNDEEDNEGEANTSEVQTLTSKQNTIPQDFVIKGKGNRTGVKGVLSDYKEAKRLEKIKFENEQLKRKEDFQKATEGSYLKAGDVSISIASMTQKKKLEKENQEENYDSDDDSFFDDENDTSFLESYRQMRLTQMQEIVLPEFGHVEELSTPIEFSNMIDEADPRVYCIIHLFNDDIGSCRLLNQHLDRLAADRLITCKFSKIEALTLRKDFDFIGFPCVLIYKAGKEVANLTPITEMFVDYNDASRKGLFTMEEVESVLKNCFIIE